jgi:tetratricopeptide (TPR) repeat protein
MNKENVLFSLVGVLLGFIVGFVFANTANRGAAGAQGSAVAGRQVEGLPPGHPDVDPSATRPQVDEAALGQATKLADSQADNFAAQSNAARLYSHAERYDDAVKYYERANKLKPDDYETVVALGNTLFDANKFVEAEKWYASALAKNADDVNVRTDMGLTLMFRDPPELDRAVAEFERSLERDPVHAQTLQNLAVAYTRKGDVARAEATLAKLEAASPKNPALAQLRTAIEQARAGAQTPAETSAVKETKK